jgi:hypothetical protein
LQSETAMRNAVVIPFAAPARELRVGLWLRLTVWTALTTLPWAALGTAFWGI